MVSPHKYQVWMHGVIEIANTKPPERCIVDC